VVFFCTYKLYDKQQGKQKAKKGEYLPQLGCRQNSAVGKSHVDVKLGCRQKSMSIYQKPMSIIINPPIPYGWGMTFGGYQNF